MNVIVRAVVDNPSYIATIFPNSTLRTVIHIYLKLYPFHPIYMHHPIDIQSDGDCVRGGRADKRVDGQRVWGAEGQRAVHGGGRAHGQRRGEEGLRDWGGGGDGLPLLWMCVVVVFS